MAAGNLQYKEQGLRVDRRYFTGSDTIVEGQPFCYQESVATASVTKGFGFDIEIPNTNNQTMFAGIAASSAIGVTGPAYIDIIIPRPGDVMRVMCSNGADLALNQELTLNYDRPTDTELGAFDELLVITATGSIGGTLINSLVQEMIYGVKVVIVGQSVPSTTNIRSLAWVQFI